MSEPASDLLDAQLAGLALEPGRPIIVSDADEVLFAFMAGFETYLRSQQFRFRWDSYALLGNIRRAADDVAIEREEVQRLLAAFFAEQTEHLAPIPGAAESLAALARRAQVVILSNVPHGQREARLKALASNGMPYPLIANQGSKGRAVRALADRVGAPVFFIDDIPSQHSSVRKAVSDAFCLHFVGEPRLARLLPQAEDSDHRADVWHEALPVLEARLAALGY
jgi:phosphoglycolate phosphatase-like HAD superfamily hydrolase